MKSIQYVLGLTLSLILFSQSALAASKKAGHIALVRGEVFILNDKQQVVADPEGKRGRDTKIESPFFEGETIQTKSGARVKLLFIEGGNEVVLGGDTSLVIARAGAQGPGTELNLAKGTVRSSVNREYSGKGRDVFEVKTPNSVAGVRGTVFQVNFDMNSAKTTVYTEHGVVAVQSVSRNQRGPEVKVVAGSFSEVSKAKIPTQSKKMSASAKKDLNLINENGDSEKGSKQDAPKDKSPDFSKKESDGSGSKEVTNSNKKSDGPSVAMAPAPVDTMSGDTKRGPASVAPTETMMMPSSSSTSMATKMTTNPMEMVNQQSDAMRRQMEESLRQQRLIEGRLTGGVIQIK